MVSHKHKHIFVHIPKCGGSSLTGLLKDLNICVIDHNIRNPHFKYLRDRVSQDRENYIFTFTRNPWDRLVSSFFYLKQGGVNVKDKIDSNRYLSDYSSFEDMVVNWNESLFNQLHFMEQYKWIHDGNGELMPDFIGKLENIQQDFDTVCDKIGIPQQKLPHKNKSKHKHYTEYYDEETKQLVAETYAKDIEYFGYKFGD